MNVRYPFLFCLPFDLKNYWSSTLHLVSSCFGSNLTRVCCIGTSSHTQCWQLELRSVGISWREGCWYRRRVMGMDGWRNDNNVGPINVLFFDYRKLTKPFCFFFFQGGREVERASERSSWTLLCLSWIIGWITNYIARTVLQSRRCLAALGPASSHPTRVLAFGTCLYREFNSISQTSPLQVSFWAGKSIESPSSLWRRLARDGCPCVVARGGRGWAQAYFPVRVRSFAFLFR